MEVITAAGEKASVLFQDGTMLRLGPESRITTSDAPDSRQVTLEGEAYFAVAKDPNRPFVIRTEAGKPLYWALASRSGLGEASSSSLCSKGEWQ
jgi:ferric-dicitrate binding protein FerR (iron transport regulator)